MILVRFVSVLLVCVVASTAFIPPTTPVRNVATSSSSSSSTTTGIVSQCAPSTSALSMALTLYGSPGSRSPLVNWACYELGIANELQQGDLGQNPHPFSQIPCLTDDLEDGSKSLIFESGAILQYLNQKYAPSTHTPALQASILSWIAWANASLDPICFLETSEGKVYDTGLRKPNKRIDRLNEILGRQTYLAGDGSLFTLADVAVASYLLYVIQFFPDVRLDDKYPNVVRYMKECAKRETYGQAFGGVVQSFVTEKLGSSSSPLDGIKKLFGR